MRSLAGWLALCGLLFASRAVAQDEFASRFDAGVTAYNTENYELALSEFDAAYKLRQQVALLYHLGRTHARLGHREEAITFYRRYVAAEASPDAPRAAEVTGELARLGASAAAPGLLPSLSGDVRLIPVHIETQRHRPLYTAGAVLLAVGYTPAFICGILFSIVGNDNSSSSRGSIQSGGNVLLLPVVGAIFTGAAYREVGWGLTWALTSGVIQAAGFAMTIAGALTYRKVTVIGERITLVPYVAPQGGGLLAGGRF
ncbi:MAG: tetratricopeptide repeat protein [Myxococcales bacterium]|nr:tetratricopeptide repeat protein [Myxococcales bacterium]